MTISQLRLDPQPPFKEEGGRACECDYCPCDDRAEKLYETDLIEDEQGGWLCWNCAIGQHHSCDFFWCPPSHRDWAGA